MIKAFKQFIMINFCTLFDSNYLARGLRLYESLSQTCPSFHLYVIAFDDIAYNYLYDAAMPHLTPISLKDFEDEQLLKIKPTRSAAEYCWTCTPSTILYCINIFKLPSCTYIDADMVFYQDPHVLIEEAGDKSILITEHRYSKDYDQGKTHGIYCVQFMHFRNDAKGMTVLQWWRERCIEWCYARLEDGKFGDQKYLDDWTTRFEGVHVLTHPGGGVAPWNLQQYTFSKSGQQVIITRKDNNKPFPFIFFHFHGLKFYTNGQVSCCGTLYEITDPVKDIIYKPYIKELLSIETKLQQEKKLMNPNGRRAAAPSKSVIFRQFLKELLVMFKLGLMSPFKLKNYNFSDHYHFYKTDNL